MAAEPFFLAFVSLSTSVETVRPSFSLWEKVARSAG
jgi:hypothetical protein